MTTAHDPSTISAALARLDGWEQVGASIRREWRFGSFRAAMDFVQRVADLAEAANHHPELTNVYDKVTIVLTTHDAGGVTDADLELAAAIDQAVQSRPPGTLWSIHADTSPTSTG